MFRVEKSVVSGPNARRRTANDDPTSNTSFGANSGETNERDVETRFQIARQGVSEDGIGPRSSWFKKRLRP